MYSNSASQNGFTLVEMIITFLLFGVMAAVGSLLINKLAPSYLVGVQAEEALSPREAALWRLSEDFRHALIEGMDSPVIYASGCEFFMPLSSGVNGANSEVVANQLVRYDWLLDSKQLWISTPWVSGNGMVLDNVTLPSGSSCPFTYVSGIGSSERAHLNVVFKHSAGVNEPVAIPVSTTLYSYVNGPYVATISPISGAVSTTVAVSIGGYFPGMANGIISSVTFMSGTVPVSSVLTGGTSTLITANISSVASAVVDVGVATPEGLSTLKKAFTFQ